MNKPILLRVIPLGIPDAMKAERRWVVWHLVYKPGRSKLWTKVPFIPWALDREASSTDPKTWGSFGAAMAAYVSGLCDGIGFVLGDGWVGFDADNCRDSKTGAVESEAFAYYRTLDTYTEVSPSGSGLHAIAYGQKPGKRCRIGRFEQYEHGRYFTVSGHRLAEFPATVEERSTEIAVVYEQLFGADTGGDMVDVPAGIGTDLTDEAVLAKASQSAKFSALWNGDFSAYQSQSEADCALCLILSFWTCRDAARIDALFRRSKLYRQKWDREDYRRRTIECAIALTDDVFQSAIPYHPLEPDTPTVDWDLDTPTGSL